MEEINVTIQKQKSIAPLILGIIGTVCNIPNILCATLCAATSAAVVEVAANEQGTTVMESGQTAVSTTFYLVLLAGLLCFIFAFFGKSKISMYTGIVTLLLSLLIIIISIPTASLFGIIAGICYMIEGIMSMVNKTRA